LLFYSSTVDNSAMRFFGWTQPVLILIAFSYGIPVEAQALYFQTQSSPIVAQSLSSSSWTEAYAAALESQTPLVVRTQPLDTTLTRIELAQWLAEFFGLVPDQNRVQTISDIEPNSPDFWTAQASVQSGVMRLYEGNAFRPEGNLTKLEALAIMVRVLQLPSPTQEEVTSWISLYSDKAEIPDIGQTFVAMGGKAGLLLNVPDPAQLSPNRILSRGEGVALLHQALVYRQKLPPLSPPIPQLTPPESIVATQPPVTPVQPPVTQPATPQPPVTPEQPEIFATRILPEAGVLPPGMSLTIQAQATPGGQATVDIGDSILGLPMREVSPGLYQAVYTTSNTDAINNPDIRIQLTSGGLVTQVQRRYPQLSLGNTAPPPVDSLFPAIPSQAPASQQPTPQPFSQQPLSQQVFPQQQTQPPLPDAANYPNFTGIAIQPERNLQEGDILTVRLWGDTGATAQFSLGNLAANLPMREIKPHLYEGTHVVAPTDQASNPVLRVIFSKGGLAKQYQEVYPYRIDGQIGTRSTIQAPTSGRPLDPPRVEGITVTPASGVLRTGDTLTISTRGSQGAKVTFEVLNVTPPIPMQEIAPGLYEGKVRVGSNTPVVTNGTVQVRLERVGQVLTRNSTTAINIDP
jgi:hypothetical protein